MIMNIIETPLIMEAKTSGYNNKNVSYHFTESSHSLCLDKREIILAQIQACEKLIKYTIDKSELIAIEKEIAELKLVLDLIKY